MARQSPHSVQHGRDDSYLRMVRAFPLRPIRSESELGLEWITPRIPR